MRFLRKAFLLVMSFLLFAITLIVIVSWALSHDSGYTEETLQRRFEEIRGVKPLALSSVEAFLRKEGFKFTVVDIRDEWFRSALPDEAKWVLVGIKRGVRKSLIVSTAISIRCYFDVDTHFLSHEVREIHTGL